MTGLRSGSGGPAARDPAG